MNQTVLTVIVAVLFSIAVLWGGAVGLISYRNWHDTHSRVEMKREAEKQHCFVDYTQQDAVERCVQLHDVQYVTEINIAIATRVAIAAAPTLVVALIVALTWRTLFGRPKAARSPRRPAAQRRPT